MDYAEFRSEYERQHPASVPVLEPEVSEYSRYTRAAVLATFVAAALVSGVHTVPTVWESIQVGELITPEVRSVVSLASVAAIELAILLSAYLMAKGVWLAYLVMGLSSLVAIMANLYSAISAFQDASGDGALAVAVVLGIGAPLIALLMGKMFVDINRSDRIQHARAQKTYREARVAFDREVNLAWERFQRRTVRHVSTARPVDMSTADSVGTSIGHGQGYAKNMDAAQLAHRHFADNPGDLMLPVRVGAARIGVSKSTVHNVQKELRGVQSNGQAVDNRKDRDGV